MTPVQEFNEEAYQRKWRGTFAVHANKEELKFGFIWTIYENKMEVQYTLNGVKEKIPPKLFYWRFPSQYFVSGKEYYLLTKRIIKSFHIGLSPETHHIFNYNKKEDRWVSAQFTNCFKLNPFSKIEIPQQKPWDYIGPLSDRIFLGSNRLYYLKSPIGLRDGNTIFLLSPELKPDVENLLKESKWKIIA